MGNFTPAEGTAAGQADFPSEDLTLVHTDQVNYAARDGARWDAEFGGALLFSMMIGARQRVLGLLQGHIDGLVLSNDTDTDHDIQIGTGSCGDSTGEYLLALSSVLTKQIDANWAEGDDAGGFPSGLSLTADTWYHVFLIYKISALGVITIDGGFDTSTTAANLLSDATNYTRYRRISTTSAMDFDVPAG